MDWQYCGRLSATNIICRPRPTWSWETDLRQTQWCSWCTTWVVSARRLRRHSQDTKDRGNRDEFLWTMLCYLERRLRVHRSSCCHRSMETVRWRIWTAAGCLDNTERQLLQQVQSLDTDHTVCSWTTSALRREDERSLNPRRNCLISMLSTHHTMKLLYSFLRTKNAITGSRSRPGVRQTDRYDSQVET